MEDSFGKIIAIFMCVIQMFFIPLYLYGENVKRMEQTYIISEITYNVDNFRNTGIIDSEQYKNMTDRIYALSGAYNILITHCTSDKESLDVAYYNESVEDELEKNGYYHMKKDDYINVYVKDKKGNIIGCYGGSVKNEAY